VQALARLEHVAGPVGVAGDGVFHRRDQHLQPHRQLQRHHHLRQAQRVGGAAHVLLHQPHAVGGLMSRPPLSKHTPLPTSVSFGSLGLPQFSSISRGARVGRAAHGVDGREVLLQQRVADGLA
jgi:hypothetical protein